MTDPKIMEQINAHPVDICSICGSDLEDWEYDVCDSCQKLHGWYEQERERKVHEEDYN